MKSSAKLYADQTLPSFSLAGQGVRSFLNGRTTANFSDVEIGSLVRTCCLNKEGNVRSIIEVKLLENEVKFVLLAGNNDSLFEEFDRSIFPADNVSLLRCGSIRRLQCLEFKSKPRFQEVVWLDINDPLPRTYSSYKKASTDQFEIIRIELGLPFGEGEINGKYNPFELGIQDLVDMNKGCYLGQEKLLKISRSGQVKQQLRFWKSTKSRVLVGEELYKISVDQNKHRKIGIITSAKNDLENNATIGLAMIRNSALHLKQLNLLRDSEPLMIKTPITLTLPLFND